MKKIGIIAAMNEEMQEIKNIMSNIEEKNIYNLRFYIGIIENRECVLVECGIGKVNAARTTQILIDNFQVEFIVNIGTAASTIDKLNITDVVIGKRLVQHDFDITAFGHEKGYITGIGRFINSDENLLKKCEDVMNYIDTDNSYNVHVGTIASGDLFCTDKKVADNIYKEVEKRNSILMRINSLLMFLMLFVIVLFEMVFIIFSHYLIETYFVLYLVILQKL